MKLSLTGLPLPVTLTPDKTTCWPINAVLFAWPPKKMLSGSPKLVTPPVTATALVKTKFVLAPPGPVSVTLVLLLKVRLHVPSTDEAFIVTRVPAVPLSTPYTLPLLFGSLILYRKFA